MTTEAQLDAFIDAHQDQHLARIQDFVRQPSVSLEQQALPEGAAWFADSLRRAGCADAAVLDVGDAYPGVFGAIDQGRARTLWIYGHYDVRPVGTERWTHPPFDAAVLPFAGFPRVVMGRGAQAKGPLQAFLNTIGAMRAVGMPLPVNLVFLIEGAEILGSPNYPRLVAARETAMARADAIYGPRASQDASGAVAVTLGYKGLIYLELIASGTAWGRGPDGGAVHSATQAVVDNPAWRLVQALATITDASGTKIAVPALLEALKPGKAIADWERPHVEKLRARLTGGDPNGVIPGLSPQFPVRRFRDDLPADQLAERYLYGPSVNISGLRAGYTGPGTKSFLLPDRAVATLDMRLVTEVPAQEILAILRRHLDQHGFADIAIDARCAYDWNQTSPDSHLIRAAFGLLDRAGLPISVWPMQAFGGPWAHFARTHAIPSVQGAAPGHGARAATSDEFFVLDGTGPVMGLAGLEKHFARFLHAFATA